MTVYHHYPKSSVRPNRFNIVWEHPLWNDVEFAFLGKLADGLVYFDSGMRNLEATFEGGLNEADWRTLNDNRRGLYFDTSSKWVDTGLEVQYRGPVTVHSVASFPTTGASRAAWGGYAEGASDVRWNRLQLSSYANIGWIYGHSVLDPLNFPADPFVGRLIHWTMRSTGNSDLMEAYADGELVASRYDAGQPPINPVPFDIGRGRHGETFWRYHVGDLGDVILWQRMLDVDEIEVVGNPDDPMFGGALEPISTMTYFIPSAAPTAMTNMFESVIFD